MKRPAVIIGTPFYNWGRDYYAVGEDHVNDFKKQPIRMSISWILFVGAVAAWATKPDLKKYKNDLAVKNALISRLCEISMNPTSQEYFDTANGLMGRGQMGQMNFFLFTIFYADKYGDKCYNQIVTTKPLQMGIVQKFKAIVDVGFMGRLWALQWHSTDIDHPSKGLLGEPLKETIEESKVTEVIRRLRNQEKYLNLIVEERSERWPQGEGLKSIKLDLESVSTQSA